MDTNEKAKIQVVIAQCLDYIYAISHSSETNGNPVAPFYYEFTMANFPMNIDYFYELAYLGAQLRHLSTNMMEDENPGLFPFVGTGDNIIREIRHDANLNRLYINTYQYFENIDSDLYEINCMDNDGKWIRPIADSFNTRIDHKLSEMKIKFFQQELFMRRKMLSLILRINSILSESYNSAYP